MTAFTAATALCRQSGLSSGVDSGNIPLIAPALFLVLLCASLPGRGREGVCQILRWAGQSRGLYLPWFAEGGAGGGRNCVNGAGKLLRFSGRVRPLGRAGRSGAGVDTGAVDGRSGCVAASPLVPRGQWERRHFLDCTGASVSGGGGAQALTGSFPASIASTFLAKNPPGVGRSLRPTSNSRGETTRRRESRGTGGVLLLLGAYLLIDLLISAVHERRWNQLVQIARR